MRFFKQMALATAMLAPVALHAQTWTTWNSGTCGANGSWSGTDGSTTLTYTGACNGGELSDGTLINGAPLAHTDYFSPTAPYTQDGLTAPDAGGNKGFIQFFEPYAGTLTFSSTVHNPLLAFVSLGQPNLAVTLTFGGVPAFAVLSNNNCPTAAHWGCGSYTTTTTTLTGNEFSGTVELLGDFDSIDFSGAPGENWYGFTVGINGPAGNVTPEPATMSLLALGLVGLAGLKRRRRTA